MAIVDVKVPQLSESVAEATLLQWKKKPGEAVAADEILIEIETDKGHDAFLLDEPVLFATTRGFIDAAARARNLPEAS